MDKQLHWGIIGLGEIAGEFARNMVKVHPIYAVASRDREKAEQFKQEYGAQVAYGDYNALLRDNTVDIVYIATVNSQHLDNITACLNHGKHVLCEKAIWGCLADLKKCAALADSKGLLLAEAMTIFHMPLLHKVKALVERGALGKLKFIEAELGSLKEDDPSSRFFSRELGGGSMLDIGTYALSFVTCFMQGEIQQMEHLMTHYPTGVDESWGIKLKSSADVLASVNLTFRAKLPKRGIIAGDQAYIEIDNYVRADEACLVYPDGRRETIRAGKTADALLYEILDMEEAVLQGDKRKLHLDNTLQVVELIDRLLHCSSK